jgi:sugar-phosphatase
VNENADMIRTAIFDMDGLMVDTEPLWREAEKQVFASVGIALDDNMMRETMGLRADEVVAYRYHLQPWSQRTQKQVLDDILYLVRDLIASRAEPLPGLHALLDFFPSRNIGMALASSSHMMLIQTVLAKFDLEKRFEVVHSAEDEPYGKPHPAIYLSTAQRMHTYPADCLALEDSFNGLIAAKAARMKVVAIPDAEHRNDPRFGAADLVLQGMNDFTAGRLDFLNTLR